MRLFCRRRTSHSIRPWKPKCQASVSLGPRASPDQLSEQRSVGLDPVRFSPPEYRDGHRRGIFPVTIGV